MGRWGRNWNGEVKINRKDEAELEKAIADLIARDFEVIPQGNSEHEKNHFNRRHNSIDNRAIFSDRSVYRNYWAVLRKKSI